MQKDEFSSVSQIVTEGKGPESFKVIVISNLTKLGWLCICVPYSVAIGTCELQNYRFGVSGSIEALNGSTLYHCESKWGQDKNLFFMVAG